MKRGAKVLWFHRKFENSHSSGHRKQKKMGNVLSVLFSSIVKGKTTLLLAGYNFETKVTGRNSHSYPSRFITVYHELAL
jgi:hypothetical protein